MGGEHSHRCTTPAPQYTSRREPTTNSTHIWCRVQEMNPGHTGGRRALSPLHHPCSPIHIKERTNNKLNPHMVPGPGNEPRPHWWEASALTAAPPLLPNTHQGENQQQTQPTYDAGSGNRTQATLGGRRALSPLRQPGLAMGLMHITSQFFSSSAAYCMKSRFGGIA